ncbi:unnamed protein product [Adineta steineri]|uniref:NHL repeat containing protein n=1 Tax=Adineta steineri TaxID=433720 RepID=A0A813TQK8_9BILA|nr:unnamed protein product [Adineta steineri]
MNTINICCYVVFIIFNITVQIKSQICEKKPQYSECSTNSACGCFCVIGAHNDAGICGFRWLACSRLVLCNSSNNLCSQPNTTCVQHPECNDLPVCYPVTMTDQSICPPMKNKTNLEWKQNGITMAGGNGPGKELNQLNRPRGILVDEKKNIFIADSNNHRIVEWKYNAKEGQITAGGNGAGNQMDQLNYPSVVIVDQQNQSIIIADNRNRRVIQWVNQTQQILIHNIDCYAGGNGKGDQLNQFSSSTSIFVDEDQSVYVSDSDNNRVVKWRKDAKEGTVVAGGNGYGENLNQLSEPARVIIDYLGQIYVVDHGNDRVMRWCEGKEEGEIVVGGNGQGNQSNQFFLPMGLSFDDERNLYVADHYNHRIQKFEIIL